MHKVIAIKKFGWRFESKTPQSEQPRHCKSTNRYKMHLRVSLKRLVISRFVKSATPTLSASILYLLVQLSASTVAADSMLFSYAWGNPLLAESDVRPTVTVHESGLVQIDRPAGWKRPGSFSFRLDNAALATLTEIVSDFHLPTAVRSNAELSNDEQEADVDSIDGVRLSVVATDPTMVTLQTQSAIALAANSTGVSQAETAADSEGVAMVSSTMTLESSESSGNLHRIMLDLFAQSREAVTGEELTLE